MTTGHEHSLSGLEKRARGLLSVFALSRKAGLAGRAGAIAASGDVQWLVGPGMRKLVLNTNRV